MSISMGLRLSYNQKLGFFLKRHIIILIFILRRRIKSISGRRVTIVFESVIISRGIHFTMEFPKWGVKIIQIVKLTKLPDEFQTDIFQSTISVLGHNKFGLSFCWRMFIVIPFVNFIIFGTVNERNNIGILLNRSRFT